MALEAKCQMDAVNDKGLIPLTYKDFLPISEKKKAKQSRKIGNGYRRKIYKEVLTTN